MIDEKETIKSGFVSIIGRPNVGKSTLLNLIVKNKVSIVTSKAQTTRNKIQGIYNDDDSQIILIDTPGIHTHKNILGKNMNKFAFNSIKSVDIILFIVPANEIIGENDNFILDKLINKKIPIILVISKIDLVSKEILNEKIQEWNLKFKFDNILTISAKENININKLIEYLKTKLPSGPRYFPKDQYTNQPEKFIIKEIIREKILLLTEQEIPHSTVVLVNNIEENNNILKIYASIVVEKESQKPIIIGKNGQLIKKIGILSRQELETFFNSKIFLDLFVKVEEKWRNNDKKLKKLGYS